jgi:non-ribosomal peptide synthetase-like protein
VSLIEVPSTTDRPAELPGFFDRAVGRWPTAVAIDVPPGPGRGERRELTYAELGYRSDDVAAAVRAVAGGGSVAAVLLSRTSEQVYVAQLGILKAGCAYVCLDPAFPDEQLRHVLADSDARVLLTDAAAAARLARIGYQGPLVRVDEPLPVAVRTGGAAAGSDDVAYLIYTSGTTGRPKGVMIPHRGICNLVDGDLVEFGLGPGDRVAQGSSTAYDSSVEEIWLALAAGATLVVMDDDTARLGPDLVGWLRDERVTVLCPPPTLLRATGCADPRSELPELRLLYVGGEALPDDVAERWARGRRMVNGYGPTECTVTCLRAEVEPGGQIAIGRPVPGARAFVLGEDLRPVPPGEPGELCMSGAGLALGYRNEPRLTAEKFVAHPELGRVYRTGDLVTEGPGGTLYYHGRIDSQVKLRGYRIELEAIETVLARCPGVREAACRVEGEGPAQVLAAHVVPVDPHRPPDPRVLRERTALDLPAYMVPALFGVTAELPRGASGKLRRDALPPLAAAGAAALDGLHDPVRREIGAAVLRVMSPPGPVGPDDDFFTDLGGSSLQAAMLISELRAASATADLTVRDVYEARTVAGLAARVSTGLARSTAPPRQKSALPSLRRRMAVTAVQAGWLALELMVGAAAAYAVLIHVLPWLSGYVSLWAMPLLLLVAAAVARPVLTPISLGVAVLAKTLLIGQYRPERVPVWSGRHVRMWMVRQVVRLVPWDTIVGTEFHSTALRLLGARVGRRVHLHRGVDLSHGGWDLLTIGDDVTVGQDAALRLVSLAEGHVDVGPVTLADGATLDVRAGVAHDTVLGPGSMLSALSALPPGGRIGPDEVWDGVPARFVEVAAPAPPLTRTGATLSPTTHGLALIAARGLLGMAFALPAAVLWVVVIGTTGIRYADVLTALAHPLAYLLPIVAVCGLSCLSLVISVFFEAVAARALGPVRPGVFGRYSLEYLRVWLKTGLVGTAGHWLSGGLYWPFWLRSAGMSVGRGCEISSIVDVVPELVKIGAGTFFADGVYLGGPRLRQGTVRLAELRLGRDTFLGNHVVVPAGQRLPRDILVGIATVADASTIQPGTAWFGHPAFSLPRREVVTADRSVTHEPPLPRVASRLFWEWLRFALPTVPILVLIGWAWAMVAVAAHLPTWSILLVGAPGVTLAAAAVPCLVVLALKWSLLGRVRPGVHPLWSCWCSRWDFLYVAWGFLAARVLAALEGTLLLAVYLRWMGMRIGRAVVFGDGWAQVVDPDMLHIGDGATVNAMFQAHTFEDRVLKIDTVRVDAHATLAEATIPLYGARIGQGAVVAPHSVVMKREFLAPGLHYEGVPTAVRRRD